MKKLFITYNDHKIDVGGINQIIAYLVWAEESCTAKERSFLSDIDGVIFVYDDSIEFTLHPLPEGSNGFAADDNIADYVRSVLKTNLDQMKTQISEGSFSYGGTTITDKIIKAQILRLLDNWNYVNESETLSPDFINQNKDDEIVFYYPLFSSALKQLIRGCNKLTGYIYLDEFDTSSRIGFSQIEDINLFLSINDSIEIFRQNSYEDEPYTLDTLKDKGIIKKPGEYFTNALDNTFIFDKRICFIGDVETVGRAAADYLLEYIKDVYYLDVKNGLPEDIPMHREALVILNVDRLSYQKQEILLAFIRAYRYWDKIVLLLSSKYDLFEELKSSFKFVNVTCKLNKDCFLDIFLSVIWSLRKINEIILSIPASLIENNKIKNNPLNLIFEDIDAKMIYNIIPALGSFDLASFLETGSVSFEPNYFWETGFWYNAKLEADHQKALRKISKPEIIEDKTNEYKWLYRGAMWEISFGYKEPFFIENLIGIYFIAHLMNSPGKRWKAHEFIKEVGAGNEKPTKKVNESNGDEIGLIRKDIRIAIKRIEDYETKLGLKNDLSQYLRKAFVPNSPLLKTDKKPEFIAFDKDGWCGFYLTEPKINWEISTPLFWKLPKPDKKLVPKKQTRKKSNSKK